MSGSKASRNQASLINRPTCGGPKKAGLSPTIGWYLSSNPTMKGAVNTQLGAVCVGNYSNSSQSALRAIRRY